MSVAPLSSRISEGTTTTYLHPLTGRVPQVVRHRDGNRSVRGSPGRVNIGGPFVCRDHSAAMRLARIIIRCRRRLALVARGCRWGRATQAGHRSRPKCSPVLPGGRYPDRERGSVPVSCSLPDPGWCLRHPVIHLRLRGANLRELPRTSCEKKPEHAKQQPK
jgi:hypothetical protein